MKKWICIVIASFVIRSGIAQNGTLVNSDVIMPPAVVTHRFTIDYPNYIATWTLDDSHNFRASYTDKDTQKTRTVIYDKDGNVIGYEREIGTGEYPEGINDYCVTHYPNEVCKIWSVEDTFGNKTYYTRRTIEMIQFDKEGKYKGTTKIKK